MRSLSYYISPLDSDHVPARWYCRQSSLIGATKKVRSWMVIFQALELQPLQVRNSRRNYCQGSYTHRQAGLSHSHHVEISPDGNANNYSLLLNTSVDLFQSRRIHKSRGSRIVSPDFYVSVYNPHLGGLCRIVQGA